MPASRISLVQFSYSDATKPSSRSFGRSHTSPPLFSKRSLRSGNEARISLGNFAMISGGVLAGTKIPSQESTSRPGTPASDMVGTSGASGLRFDDSTAMPLACPDCTYGRPAAIESKNRSTRPASRSVNAGGEPLYGTSSSLMPAAFMKAAATSCWPVPTPAAATGNEPGLAFPADHRVAGAGAERGDDFYRAAGIDGLRLCHRGAESEQHTGCDDPSQPAIKSKHRILPTGAFLRVHYAVYRDKRQREAVIPG